jgi:CRISPR-associated protein Cmr6
MPNSYRSSLNRVGFAKLQQAVQHPGLWLDRYLERQPPRGEALTPYNDLVEQCSRIHEPAIYRPAFKRWESTLKEMGVRPLVARTTYRLAAGHGRESVIETGIALHHTYGVPYIPGSSLKGVAAGYAAQKLANWGSGSQAAVDLFGTPDVAGYVTFLDALPLPDRWKLLPDTITVHHPNYYQGSQPPADWDDPTPIPFVSAVGDFLIALYVPDANAQAWADAAYGILRMALAEDGVGGKTSSGYGRLDLLDEA